MAAEETKIPIIGLLGGIASGKSFYSRLFERRGCAVIDADKIVGEIYRRPEVLTTLAEWWGPGIRNADGTLNRAEMAKIIFSDPEARGKLEAFVHPLVQAERDALTAAARARATPPRAIVWDIPLLMEVGQDKDCDLLVFIDAPDDVRESRARSRGWVEGELAKREALQASFAKKREFANVVVPGVATEAEALASVDKILT